MTLAEAVDELKILCAWDTLPQLSEENLSSILARCVCADSEGRYADESGYVQTYDLNRAAVKAWEMKAGKAAGMYSFMVNGQQFTRAQIQQQCLEMAKVYRRRCVSVLENKPANGSKADAVASDLTGYEAAGPADTWSTSC